jgi:predicted unusual protein kinase regulating ubiquinone biosynthesis (AarF/ABC1/UbiB family)
MNIEEMIFNGASEEEINKALNKIKAEKARQEEALLAKNNKEELKREAREYAINALIAYSYAFDLLDKDAEWDDEDIAKAEEMLKKIEDMIPLYIKLAQMQGDMDDMLGLGFFGGGR